MMNVIVNAAGVSTLAPDISVLFTNGNAQNAFVSSVSSAIVEH